MRTSRRMILALVLSTIAGAASAQQRVFVSIHGDDLNPCSNTSPCRSFAHAMTVVSSNGEILALDSGGFGPVTVTQSVAIVAPQGVEASITQGTGGLNGVNINVPGATVILRGLSIFGLGTANDGIFITAADFVLVQSCNVIGFAGNGLVLALANPGVMAVSDSTFLGSTSGIVTIGNSSGSAQFSIDHSRLEKNVIGLNAFQGSQGAIRNSVADDNQTGLLAQTQGGGEISSLNVENCSVSGNQYGISSVGSTGFELVRVSNTMVANNTTQGLFSSNASAHLYTRANNTVEDNATDGAFTDAYLAK